MTWFRIHDDVINDPKVLKLPEATRWHWLAVLCVASKHDGILPPTSDLALLLRVTPAKAGTIIAALVNAKLLDFEGGQYHPHNWKGRQYKTDAADPTAASRAKKYRDRKRDGHRDDRDAAVTHERPYTEDREQKEDRIGNAGASSFTEGSKALADVFLKALGFDTPLKVPPEFAGVDWRAINWETAGWTSDLIEAEARKNGPYKPLSYHEKCFATAFAKRQAPLPIVEIKSAETLTVTHGTSQNRSGGSLTAALRRDIAALKQSDDVDFALPASSILRLSN